MSESFHPKRKRSPDQKSIAQTNRDRASDEINTHGELVFLGCKRCFEKDLPCVLMASSKSLKCAQCARNGKQCVEMSWGSLDRTREKMKEAIAADEAKLVAANEEIRKMMSLVVDRQAEMSKTLAAIERNRKTLERAQERAKSKTVCLLDELEEEEEHARKRKKTSIDDVTPEAPLFSQAFDFDFLVSVPDDGFHPDWSFLGDPGGVSGGTGSQESLALGNL